MRSREASSPTAEEAMGLGISSASSQARSSGVESSPTAAGMEAEATALAAALLARSPGRYLEEENRAIQTNIPVVILPAATALAEDSAAS